MDETLASGPNEQAEPGGVQPLPEADDPVEGTRDQQVLDAAASHPTTVAESGGFLTDEELENVYGGVSRNWQFDW